MTVDAAKETSTAKPADSPPEESFTANNNSPQTPKTMAAAAYTTAVEERKQKDQEEKKRQHDNDKHNDGEKRARVDNNNTPFEKEINTHHQMANQQWHDRDIRNEGSPETDAQERLTEIWNSIEDKHTGVCTVADFDKVVEKTTALVLEEVEATLRDGLEAYYGFDSTSRELIQTKDLAESRGREVSRLQALEGQSRTSISNLLRAVETAKVEARDSSRSAQVEARLRGEITNLRSEREDALASAAESKRKANLLEEEVRLVKAKLGRLAQEKLRQERDSRAALSLARSMDSHAMADTDFYKRKAAELSERLQSQQALAAEQKYQLDEMKRKMARNVTKNRLAEIRSEGVREMRR